MKSSLKLDPSRPWDRAMLSLALLAIDPSLGGLHVKARSGPVRMKFVACLNTVLSPVVPLHPAVTDDQLFGGLDLTATLSAGRLVHQSGLLQRPGTRVLTMAERCTPHLAARLAASLETAPGSALILLDEGVDDDESAPVSLCERLAFQAKLDTVSIADTQPTPIDDHAINAARRQLNIVGLTDDLAETMAAICVRLGIHSLRAPIFAMKVARGVAALGGHKVVETTDIEIAVSLVLAHRATQMPADEETLPKPETDDTENSDPIDQDNIAPLDDMVLAAALAMLPADFLAKVTSRTQRGAKGAGSGAKRRGNRRGRPKPAKPGRLDGKARLDLVATLRAAAPWQKLRRKNDETQLRIHASDIHVKRFETMSDRVLIFTVDASGSAAMARLAEAKGAIELLLGQAYARRDHVAMIAFRGAGAEVLLPPTRSLVQAKKRLAGLPGGGGTPLAAGLKLAGEMAVQTGQKGLTPTVVLLTDGRANITLDGTPGRPQAASDSQAMARGLAAMGIDALIIDTGARSEAALRKLADTLSAPYLALPRADSARLSQAVAANLAG